MPKRRYAAPSKKRRPKRQRRSSNVYKKNLARNITRNIVPNSKVVKLRYCTTISRNPALGVASTYIFRANSLFDPDFSSIGHQPMGFDQWATFYDHYTVVGSKITANFMSSNSSATTGSAIVGVYLKDSSAAITDVTTLMEQTNVGYKVMTASAAGQKATVSKGFSTKKFFGIRDIRDNRQLLGAPMSQNPTEDAYFHVFVGPTDGGTDPDTVHIVVTIEFMAILTERKALGQS